MDKNCAGAEGPFLAWPGWRHLGFASVVGLGWSVLFYAVYGGAAYVTGRHGFRLPCDLPFEQRIPFIPAMSVAYLFLLPAMQVSPFVVRRRGEYLEFARVLAIQVVVAGLVFLVLPARDGFPAPDPEGPFAGLFRFADAINLNHNNVPSLHVAFTVTTASVYARHARTRITKAGIACLATVVVASTVLTHQHNLADVIAGYVLARVVMRSARRRSRRVALSPSKEH